jgi:hypothetical protein
MNIFNKLFGSKGGDGEGDGGETPEFKALIDGSMEGLQLQTEAHQGTWGMGQAERWSFSQDEGELIFTFADKVVRAPAQIIGSFDSAKGTWMWAWGNSTIAEALAQDSARVRAYGEEHGIARLTTRSWPASEMDGWEMVALANRLCESNGAYRAPAGTAFVFFTFGEIRIEPR